MRFVKVLHCMPRNDDNSQDALELRSELAFTDEGERASLLSEHGIPLDSTVTIRGAFNVLRTEGIYQDPLVSIDGHTKEGTPVHASAIFIHTIAGGIAGAFKFFTQGISNYVGPFGETASTLLLAAYGARRA